MITTNQKVIGFYDESFNPSGTTRYLIEIICGLDRQQFQPIVFSSTLAPWHSRLRDLDVEIVTLDSAAIAPGQEVPFISPPKTSAGTEHSLPVALSPRQRLARLLPDDLKWSLGQAQERKKLVQLFNKRAVDLLHSNHAGAELGPIAAREAGVPRLLATWHVDSTYDLNNERNTPRYHQLEKRCMGTLDHVIAVSNATRDNWVQRCGLSRDYQQKISVIHNGVDISDFRPLKTKEQARQLFQLPIDSVLLGSLGRLDPAKGFEYLLKALPAILQQYPSVFVAIAGSGPLEAELKNLAAQLELNERVRFLGFTSETRTFLESLDIYVQPSLCEAHPFGTLEAGAMGLPIVASAVGGIPETVLQGENGYVVPPRDPQALAEKLSLLIEDAPLRESMSFNSRKRVEDNFTSSQMIAKTISVYEKMLETPA